MIYARPPTAEEFCELKRLTRQAIGRVSQRAQLILLWAQRYTVPELATLVAMSRATVRLWLHRFNAHGPAGLSDDPRSGRPPKVGPRAREALLMMLPHDPWHEGYLATCWTVAMLGLALLHKLGVRLSGSALRTALHQWGLRWGRPRLAMPTKVDPEKARKQWRMAKVVVEAGPEAALLYADESRLQLLPLIRAMWHGVGEPRRVPTPGTNITRALFGALHMRTGRWVFLVRERLRKEDVIAFLEPLPVAYPHGPIGLMVDHFRRHTAHAVTAWLGAHPRIHWCYWPTYCAPVNPIERIWLRLKTMWAPNRLSGSRRLFVETLEAFFTAMTPAHALTRAAA
jgi:transposase